MSKRFLRLLFVPFLIYIAAVSIGHSIHAESRIDALEQNLEYLLAEFVKIHEEQK